MTQYALGTLEEKIRNYGIEDINCSNLLTPDEFLLHCNQRRLFYLNLGRDIEREREKLFYEILEPLKIKPIVKRDLKTILFGTAIATLAPISIVALITNSAIKYIFKTKPKHSDQYTTLVLAIPLFELQSTIKEITNPTPIAYKIKNKDKLKTNNSKQNTIGISLIKPNNLTFNADYIKVEQENEYPIELHFSNNTSFSLNKGFNEINSTEYIKKSILYFEANPELIEKFEIYSKISKAYVEIYNQLESFEKETFLRSIKANPHNWKLKAVSL